MPRVTVSTSALLGLGALVAGCQSAPVQYAGEGMQTSASAVRTTGGELYHGASAAVRAPLRDLNMMQDPIAPVLLRAESHPYDLTGVDSCNDVLDRVAELDLALGPDVDSPKQRNRTRVNRGADFAASAALDAAGSAAEHFIPMRSTIKQISGAQRYERHAAHATLAGETRRSFLKAIGMEHNCTWPAAPLQFTPTVVADAAAPWNGPAAISPAQTGGAPVRLASASIPSAVAPSPGRPATVGAPSLVVATAPVQPATSRVVMVSAASTNAAAGTPIAVAVRDPLAIPSPTAAITTNQAWRPPATSQGRIVPVSEAVPQASMASNGGSAPSPWGASFSSTSSARP